MLERQKYEYLRAELKKARLEADMLQSELAKTLKRPQSFVSKIESGERGLDLIEYLDYASALGLDPIKWLKRLLDRF